MISYKKISVNKSDCKIPVLGKERNISFSNEDPTQSAALFNR